MRRAIDVIGQWAFRVHAQAEVPPKDGEDWRELRTRKPMCRKRPGSLMWRLEERRQELEGKEKCAGLLPYLDGPDEKQTMHF